MAYRKISNVGGARSLCLAFIFCGTFLTYIAGDCISDWLWSARSKGPSRCVTIFKPQRSGKAHQDIFDLTFTRPSVQALDHYFQVVAPLSCTLSSRMYRKLARAS